MYHFSKFNMENQRLHYFTGRVRAFWKNLIFFSDARNVAVIDIHDVFIHGIQASSRDLTYLNELVGRSDWKRSPEFHSFVSEYPPDFHPPWPYQLTGKILWKATCAWLGLMPYTLKSANIDNIVYMPISYYTGEVVEFYDDKVIFGDFRNTVIVNSDNFYINGERGSKKNDQDYLVNSSCVHAYVIRLEVLTDVRYGGPKPDVPTWPREHFSSDMWVAKFAWCGEMPDEVRDQVGRYNVIRMNHWGNTRSVPYRNERNWQGCANEKTWKENFSSRDKQRTPEKKIGPCQSLVPRQQHTGYMKGCLLLADNKQGLMTSYADLIAFSKDNFYINGQKFKPNYDLSLFFEDHRVPLTAWVVPFDEQKTVFNIRVVWHGVCVWYGSPPEDLEYIKKGACGKPVDTLVETTAPVSFTFFVGNVHHLSFASGFLLSEAGLNQPVKIFFKRKDVHLYGRKLSASCSLLDKQQLMESKKWSVLACPMKTDEASNTPQYQALAMWHFDDQHSMYMLSDIISEFVDKTKNHIKEKEKLIHDTCGVLIEVTEDYGIIQTDVDSGKNKYLYFRKEVLYTDGELFPKNVSLESVRLGKLCSVQAKTILPKKVGGYQVTMEATLVWIGRKPSFECRPSDYSEDTKDDKESCAAAEIETGSLSKLGKVLHAAEGVMVGSVFIVEKYYGLVICSDVIVGFASDTFYEDGEKIMNKYGSLSEFCSDKKVIVRAMVVSLKEPKVKLNCLITCEAVCVWIGQDPKDLKHLQKTFLYKNKTSDTFKKSYKSMLYFKGRMTNASQDVTLLTSTTPEGTLKIMCSKENLFLNGTKVHEKFFEKCKKSSQNWSVLALPMPPKNIMGQSVYYSAVAVWDMSHHHKMRKVLSPLLDELSGKVKATLDTPEALFQTLQLEDGSKGDTSPLQSKNPSISQITRQSSNEDSTLSIALAVSRQEFCGKHITGYIVKKTGQGGVAQWKSQHFEGYVFIEFSVETLYLESKPICEEWNVIDVQSRPCNFYVIPIPHCSVKGYTVSLKATCGWIGKKPSQLPSPGTQRFPKIDLGSVHVTQPVDNQGSELGLDEVESPHRVHQNGYNVKEPISPREPVHSHLSNATTKGVAKGKTTQNGDTLTINCNTHNQTSSPQLPSKLQNAHISRCETIWKDENKRKNQARGKVVEVHSSVGQLKGEDGSLHYFSRESCHLYGVPLCNVELWHVLAQDDPVLYTVTELVPGMMKVQRVWLGALELPDKKTATEHILDWCQMKLVPDGARDILLSQLELE